MDLNFEYKQDVVIEGVNYVLNNVENLLSAEGTLIRRIFISADGKHKKIFEQIVPGTKPVALAPPPVPAPEPADKPEDPEKSPETKADPKAEKRGFLGRTFGGKDKKNHR